ncbi:MAG: hypothetical protein AAF737_09170 [Pseudomonadota bacterium]
MGLVRLGAAIDTTLDQQNAGQVAFAEWETQQHADAHSYLTPSGADFMMRGENFNRSGEAIVGGTVKDQPNLYRGSTEHPFSQTLPWAISLDLDDDSLVNPDFTIEGLSLPVTSLIDLSLSDDAFANKFWGAALSGQDVIDFDIEWVSRFAGDGRDLTSGTLAGMGDHFILSGTQSGNRYFSGDAYNVSNATLTGGDDRFDVTVEGTGFTFIYGDARRVDGTSTITGGNDVFDFSGADKGVYVRGDVGTFASTATLIGGDDHITGSDHDDELSGEGNVTLGQSFSGGNDVIYGKGGNDRLEGGSGFNYLDGGAGYDTVSYSQVDTTGAAFIKVISPTMGKTVVYVARLVDRETDVLVDVEKIVGLSEPIAENPFSASATLFDGLGYIASHGDLVAAYAGAGSANQLNEWGAQHYAAHGHFEGRMTDEVTPNQFSATAYKANWTDLAAMSDGEATAHYINHGFAEGRIALDGLLYLASHDDLAAAFGADRAAGVSHYMNHGATEGRKVTFDAEQYVANYADLQPAGSAGGAYVVDPAAAAQHYLNHGRTEGRTDLDWLDYVAANADLVEAFGDPGQVDFAALKDAALFHYLNHGRAEGRATDFNAAQYLANYADLAASFGQDHNAATQHYIQHGYYEQRTDDFMG